MALAAVSPAGALGGLGAPALDLASGSVGSRPLAMAGALSSRVPDFRLLVDTDSESDGELLAAVGALPEVPGQAAPPPLQKPRRVFSRAVHNAVRTGLRRLCPAVGQVAAPVVNEQLNRLKAGLIDESGEHVSGLLLAAAQTRMYNFSSGNHRVKRKALPGGQQLKDASDQSEIMSAPGLLVTGWTRLHELPAVAACIAATTDDEQLGQELAKCPEVQCFVFSTSPYYAVLAAARNRLGGVFVWGVCLDDHFLAIEKHGQDTTPTVLEGRVLVMGFRSSFQ